MAIYRQDELRLFRGADCPVNEFITIHQPTLGEICEYGEQEYFHMIHTLCSVGADLKWQLAEQNIDYTMISDYELFYSILARGFSNVMTKLLFGDTLDFSCMEIRFNESLKENVLVQFLNNGNYIQIDKYVYSSIVGLLRKIHKLKRNEELPGNDATKRILIDDAKDEYEAVRKNPQPYKSSLLPLISAMINSEGFKHNEQSIFDMKIYPFMDSVQRIGRIKNADLLLQSGYSGFGVDLRKIDKDTLNWLGELD